MALHREIAKYYREKRQREKTAGCESRTDVGSDVGTADALIGPYEIVLCPNGTTVNLIDYGFLSRFNISILQRYTSDGAPVPNDGILKVFMNRSRYSFACSR